MKYKVKALEHSEGKWESKYIMPEGKVLMGGVVQTADSFLLHKYFGTKAEADNYAIEHLMKTGISRDQIEVKE